MSGLLRAAARLWGALPNEQVKTELWARFGARFLVSVWAVVLDEAGRVLLFHHTHDRAHPWGVPSGRLERHETPEQAICREFAEEVGGRLRPRRLLGAFSEPDLCALRLAYQCDLEMPPSRPSIEIAEWQFFPSDALPPTVRPLQRSAIAAATGGAAPSALHT